MRIIFLLILLWAPAALSETLCIRGTVNGSAIQFRTRTVQASCPRGFRPLLNLSELVGPRGEAGEQGAQGPKGDTGERGPAGDQGPAGDTYLYGDGSGGDLIVVNGETVTLDQNRLDFDSITLDSGGTIIVPSGAVLRVKKYVILNGNLDVQASAQGCYRRVHASTLGAVESHANPGVAQRASGAAESVSQNNSPNSGAGGIALSRAQARLLRYPGLHGGGGGGCAGGISVGHGADGGGSFVFLVGEELYLNGRIAADGQDASALTGGGGGGGGVIILGAGEQITFTATGRVYARGGDGGAASTDRAAGGGGGGGIVHFISPAITNNGQIAVTGGSAGINGGANSVTDAIWGGGGGGGASGGDGGNGGYVQVNGTPNAGAAGSGGFSFQTLVDPRVVF